MMAVLGKEVRDQIRKVIRQQVVPAVGCTEPMAVALCTARAKENLGCIPDKITVLLSKNILKN
ncbi:MAG: serine dehydratase subunit alpha family protein, partial [Prevotella sp.]|nr:serine dehydratase subunit alpha family protein [Prevotella sp.]